MDLLIAGNLLVLHKVISSPKVMQIPGHAWQSSPMTRHDFVPKLDSQSGPERRIECFEFQDSTYKPPEDLGTLQMVAPKELAVKGLLLPGPEQLSTSGVIVLCTPPSWAHEKVSSLRKKVDGKKPQFPPQYRALDLIVQNNRSVRHFAIFPDKQNNGAPDLFEWLLSHRASDYIGFAFSKAYLELEKDLSDLAEKAKLAADKTTKAVKAIPERLAFLQRKAQERAKSIDNELRKMRVLTLENLSDEGTKLPQLPGKASVEEGLEILEKCLKKIRGLELELFIHAWGETQDHTKTKDRVKTAVFPLFPQDPKDKDASQIYSKMSDLFNKLPENKLTQNWPALIIGDPKCQEGLSLHVLASHI
ncbi:hypothetical protein EBZ37_14590, partial [bacterium]|nr:hypothetical protein [bacterium]